MADWPHQTRGVEAIHSAFARGVNRLCWSAPTGAGKSRVMLRLVEGGQPTVIYANRRMLIEQLSLGMEAAGVEHGVHMSGYGRTVWQDVQIASVQSAHAWWKSSKAELPEAGLVIVDEIHNETGQRAEELLGEHVRRGAKVVGLTATPVGIKHLVDELIVGAVTSELRDCGALVPAFTYAPDEPAMGAFKPKTKGILQFRDEVKEAMLPVIFGRVVEHFHRLNPGQNPSILFAPGVHESQWFAERLTAAGIPSAHIDGSRIWLDGETLPSDRENRRLLSNKSRDGEIKVVCNRFVLREGIDWPWLAHAIFACTFGSVSSYIQSGGRALRSHPSLESVTIQDHGGNFWRHDSLNCDREWSLDDTDARIAQDHAETYRTKQETEPVTCPQCAAVRRGGVTCPRCQFTCKGKRRMVVETDGSLCEVRGDIYKPRKVSTAPDAHKSWESCYYRCLKKHKTFSQARGLFMKENNYQVPGNDFPLTPKRQADWHRKIEDVPRSELTPKRLTHTQQPLMEV